MMKNSYWISLFLIIAAAVIVKNMNTGSDVVVRNTNLEDIPLIIGDMEGYDIPLGESVRQELDPDVYVYRDYRTSNGGTVNLYIGYYGTRKGGRTGHTPYGCYPGAGWGISQDSKDDVTVELTGQRRDITVNVTTVKKGDARQLVYHWYQSKGGVVLASGFHQNIHRFKTRLLHNRNDGAFIRVTTDVVGDNSEAMDQAERFIWHLYPLLVEFWPEEQGS